MYLILLAGCAIAPGDPEQLLISSVIVSELERERGDTIPVARFSAGRAGTLPEQFRPYTVSAGAARTEYRLVDDHGSVVLEARAVRSASGFYRRIRIDPKLHPHVEWRWKIVEPVPGADASVPSHADASARIVISFHGDVATLDVFERVAARMFKSLTGEALPFAILMYIWSDTLPVGTIISSPHTEKIQMMVVDDGAAGVRQWKEFRRNVLEDYRLAFGEEPWDIVGVGMMTDADRTGTAGRTFYGDITFSRGGK